MSDQTLTQDDIDALKTRDTRFAILSNAIAVEHDLRDNPVIKALMGAARADADQAMEELCDVSPGDVAAISFHLVKIRQLVYMRRVLNAVLRQGAAAEAAIRADDAYRTDHDE